jgi:2-polyprenyl-3-methyl-5-hydroxy-6-metoxy-1,4-benzoquinol methylase
MKLEFLELLRCPVTNQRLLPEGGEPANGRITTGQLVTADGTRRYPIRNGIPRFVEESSYADNFGMQWNTFRHTQLDSHSGHPVSADRFWSATGWTPEELKGQWVLDGGCGAGRFAEVALQAGAKVVAIDLSNAVDATSASLGHHPNLHVVQANLYALPFAPASFPFIYSLGVLQHTPDVERAFRALPPLLAAGGRLCVDYYPKTWKSALLPKYFIRPVTKRIPKPTLFAALQRVIPMVLPLNRLLSAIPVVGITLKRAVPIVDYYGELPLSPQQHREWALLDTFDMLAPEYDNPQTMETAQRWMESEGLRDVDVRDLGLVVARGRK